jgi:GTP diphosphokinase / guanosine-3',5'-bis(diphosphate) 3'-diphosphatase
MRGQQKDKDVGMVLKAMAFAASKHRNQRRKDAQASPYINHPIALADVLWHDGGVRDPVVTAAALLHDTIEDTKTTGAELRRRFGPKVAGVVVEVTDDKRLPKERRKELQIEHAAHLSKAAKLVKLADKICNLRDILASPPKDWSVDRKREYFDWAKKVIDQVRGTNPKLERRFDQLYRKKPAAERLPEGIR